MDTRAIVRHLRSRGAMRGVLSTMTNTPQRWWNGARSSPTMAGLDLATRVSVTERYEWAHAVEPVSASEKLGPRASRPPFHVVAYDYGIKQNILRRLASSGCRVTVVPSLTSAEDVLALEPDGVFLSNGPGDPEPLTPQIDNIREADRESPCVRHLPGTSTARRSPWAARRTSSSSAIAARTIRCSTSAPEKWRSRPRTTDSSSIPIR